MNSNLTFLGYLRLIFTFILLIILIYIVVFGIFLLGIRYLEEPEKSMSIEDIAYLCNELEVEKEPVCNSTEMIYPRDFSDIIRGKFQIGITSYYEVLRVLSQFQIKLDTTDDSASNLFVSYYDINRDSFSDFAFYFNGMPENSLLDSIIFTEDLEF